MLKIENLDKIKGKHNYRFEITNVYEHLHSYQFEVLDIEDGNHKRIVLDRSKNTYDLTYRLQCRHTAFKIPFENIKDTETLFNYIVNLCL